MCASNKIFGVQNKTCCASKRKDSHKNSCASRQYVLIFMGFIVIIDKKCASIILIDAQIQVKKCIKIKKDYR